MREIFKWPVKGPKSKLSLFFTILLLILFSGCNGFFGSIDFNGDIRVQLEEDIGVTYSFYEYPDLESQHIDQILITGKTISNSRFPVYEHEDTLLVGWQYLCNSQTGSTEMPDYFTFNEKNYIQTVRPGITDESLYAVWKKKCIIKFVTNWPGLEIEDVVMPAGDLLEWPRIETRQGEYRLWNWCTDPELTQWYDFSQPVEDSMTLYARWVEVRTITYHKNDGSDEENWREYEINMENEISDCMFGERSGYGFVGWADSPSGGVTKYAGDRFTITQDMDLYAVWSTDVVTITYIDKHGAFPNATARMGNGAHYSVGRVLSNEGNWYTDLGEVWKPQGKTVLGYDESSSVGLDWDGRPQVTYGRWGWYTVSSEPDHWVGSNYITITSNKTFYVYWDDMIIPGGDTHVDFTFEESPDSDIPGLVSGPTTTNGGSVTLTAISGYYEYRWYFDGVPQSSSTTNEITFDFGALHRGIYNITLVVKQGDNYYSWQGTITKN